MNRIFVRIERGELARESNVTHRLFAASLFLARRNSPITTINRGAIRAQKALSFIGFMIVLPWPSAMAAELPGGSQMQIRFPAALRPEERHSVILQGFAEQALASLPIAERVSLQPFVRLDYKVDSAEVSANNKLHPSTGVKLQLRVTHDLIFEIGGRYEWEHRFVEHRTYQGPSAFINWIGYWEIDKARATARETTQETTYAKPLGYTVSTWGQFRLPSAQIDIERGNTVLEGDVQADMDWLSLPGESRLALRGDLEFSTDSDGQDYNNKLIPSAGLVVKIPGGAAGRFEIGARYALDYRPVSGTSETGMIYFAGWSVGWKF